MCNNYTNISRIGQATVDYRRIYEYTDVTNFKFMPTINRAVSEKNVNTFVKLMKDGKFDPERGLIIIDINTKAILDGQHRVEAYKKAHEAGFYDKPLLVRYVDGPKKTAELQAYIAELQKGRKWQLEDYITANLSAKNDLRRLQEFCLNHPLLSRGYDAHWSKGACIVSRETTPKVYKNMLKQRDVRFTEEEWNSAETIYEEAKAILEAISQRKTTAGFEYIVNAWKKIRYDIDSMSQVCKLPNGFGTFLSLIKEHRADFPAGEQAVEPYYDFFTEVIIKAALATAA